ncbi:aryl-sulfate sulfotransferase [Anaerotalea alkaliphila]|uniref:Thioredoxin n=1 Tax=Anaerotalea alkaliphila TaxID=2662126 RepID=A0A7X5KMY5_9FIRM|nr:aryl-sulfate sulfotransferase [Anaerotalea alkaliphila]NDL68446.1 thioredoxin [Anaerotalea alkaliphila]
MGHPTIYPTGVTVYNTDKAYPGYTIYQAAGQGALLVDNNGREVQLWRGLDGFPNKILPGGHVLGSSGQRSPKHGVQDQVDLVQVDWDGNVVWKFDRLEYIRDPGEEPRWMARQHHDYQREGSSTGYFSPAQSPLTDRGNTLILVHANVRNTNISEKLLLDDKIIEVDWEGNIVWEWSPHEHFDELGFDEAARNILYRDPNHRPSGGGMGDWLHINSMSTLGENLWYDQGDKRFHPDNIIWDSREANIMAITSKKTGEIVWRLGPDFDSTPALRQLGWIIGQHHVHLIPKGLPGEGNVLLFDNGGWAGYGAPNPSSPTGRMNARRDHSRVLEINPVTLEIVWQYTPAEAGYVNPLDSYRFYSPFVSSAQRLPNGNTLITEGSNGRIFEVTADHELVWEYISPYHFEGGSLDRMNMVYRAYKVPYHWIPQLETPEEIPVEPLDVTTFRVPNAASKGFVREVAVEGVLERKRDLEEAVFCVISDTDRKLK